MANMNIGKTGSTVDMNVTGTIKQNGTQVSLEGHGHNYLSTSGGTLTGSLTVPNVNSVVASANNTTAYYPVTNSVGAAPFSGSMWHDHFAFLNSHAIIDNQLSSDGSTWTDATDSESLRTLFCQKEYVAIEILPKDKLSRRFTIQGSLYHACLITWFEIGITYTNPFSNVQIKVETSADKITWTTISNATATRAQATAFLYASGFPSNQNYIRFTFTKTTELTTGTLSLACIKGLTYRKGNQGLGVEYEFPYNWDSYRNIMPWNNNKQSLGTSGNKWSNVYATNFYGDLNGNATTATTATTAESAYKAYNLFAYNSNEVTLGANADVSTNEVVYINYRDRQNGSVTSDSVAVKEYKFANRKGSTAGVKITAENFNGKINGHTVNADVPSDAKFTDTTYTNATTTTAGLMSADDKTKLDSLSSSGGGGQSDWQQNDSNDASYVLNRTHWLEAHEPLSESFNVDVNEILIQVDE